MHKNYLFVISLLLVLFACSNDKNERTEETSKSYEPKKATKIVREETLPEEKIETKLPTPEPIENPTFRQVEWGMSKEDVKSRESGSVFEETDSAVAYDNIRVGGLDTYVFYNFVDNKLYFAGYLFKEKFVNDDRYVVEYNNLKDILTSKYGAPIEDNKTWLDDSDYYRDKPGTAVARGKLMYISKWSTEDTIIYLGLIGENYNITLKIDYKTTDPDLLKLVEEAEQEQIESDF